MTRRVLLVEIGTPADLPVVTPPAPRPPSAWVPDPRPSPSLPPPTGLAAVSVADAAVLTWTPSVAGGQTIIEAAPDNAGSPGIWREVDRTGADTYTLSLPGGARWARVRADLNGRRSPASSEVFAELNAILDQGALDKERAERIAADLAEAHARAAEVRSVASELAGEALQRAQDIAAERQARQASVAAAQGRINDIISDSIISPDEKPQLIIDFNTLINELPGIVVEAEASEVDPSPYQNAIGQLVAYMGTLTTPVRWDNTSDITYIT